MHPHHQHDRQRGVTAKGHASSHGKSARPFLILNMFIVLQLVIMLRSMYDPWETKAIARGCSIKVLIVPSRLCRLIIPMQFTIAAPLRVRINGRSIIVGDQRPGSGCRSLRYLKPGARLPAYRQGRVALSFRASFGDLSSQMMKFTPRLRRERTHGWLYGLC